MWADLLNTAVHKVLVVFTDSHVSEGHVGVQMRIDGIYVTYMPW